MTTRDRARHIYADSLAAQGPTWANAAASVRTGYSNCWIMAGIAAIEAGLRGLFDGEDEGTETVRASTANSGSAGAEGQAFRHPA